MRKSLRYLSTFASIIVLLVVVVGSASAAPPAPQAKWTVMVYISGDNNLEEYVVKDIELELAPTGSSANVQVVALADRGPGYDTSRGDWQTTKLYHVTPGMIADSASAVADWGERNMGDKQTLIDFVTWSKTNYPADHYLLYFWGHGWSWHPGWVMEDDTNADTLDYEETKAAIPSLGFIDVVGYDGCNMASLEIMKLWQGHATALTGSQEWVGWDGIEYDVVLAQLAANPNMTADQVAIATSQSTVTDKTWSAVAVDARLTTLMTAVDQWATALKNGLPANKKKYDTAFGATRSFWQAPMDKDLYDLAFEINRNVTDTNIKTKSQAVMTAFASVVLHERHVSQYSDAHGITIYGPHRSNQKLDYAYFLTLELAQQTQWDEFLSAYVP
ncbi:MAG TPA: clostripain-related cysteine peptidase [Anaerolineales bacterium]|nr:clostripain-related cysteine peptidase [Anaerolineales bacterium]